MEAGVIIRKEYDTDEQSATVSMLLNSFQCAWLEAFEHNKLEQGTKWFNFPCWIAGSLQYVPVQFKERPKVTGVFGLSSMYEFSIRIAKRNLWSAFVVDALMAYELEELMEWSDILEVDLGKLSGSTNSVQTYFP